MAGLEFRRITKRFPPNGRGIVDVSLKIPPGSAYALLGGNGAGKTTLLNLGLGFLCPDAGEVLLADHPMNRERREAMNALAYVPEVSHLYPHLNAYETLGFFEGLMGRRHPSSHFDEALGELHFPLDAASSPLGTYSKGMRQKVSLALGLLKGAEVFLLDEPTSGLDPASVTEFTRVLRTLVSEGKAVLFTTHHLGLAKNGADQVGVLHEGCLKLEKEAEDFHEDDFLAAYET